MSPSSRHNKKCSKKVQYYSESSESEDIDYNTSTDSIDDTSSESENIIFENVDDDFMYASIGSFVIAAMRDILYINVTSLCNGSNKKFRKWCKINSSKKLINALEQKEDCEAIINHSHGEFKGKYVHPNVMIPFVLWYDKEYALLIMDIIKEYQIVQAIKNREEENHDDDSMQENSIDELIADESVNIDEIKYELKDTDFGSDVLENSEYYEDDDLRNIIFKNIDENFAYGMLGDFKVIVMRQNGFINASKLCEMCGKHFKHWNRNGNSKKLINAVKKDMNGLEAIKEPLVGYFRGNNNVVKGTYVHPEIINHIAIWCHIEYARFVSKVMNEYNSRKIIARNNKLLKQNNSLELQIERLMKLNKKTNKNTEKIIGQNDRMYTKIVNISNDRVIKSDERDMPMFVLIKYNHDRKMKQKYKLYDYTSLRISKKNYTSTIKKITKEFSSMEILLEIEYSPNAMNLWHRIRKKLNKKLDISGTKFNIEAGYSEKRLIEDIKKIHNKRLEIIF